MAVKLKTREEIEIMRKANRYVAEFLKELEGRVKPGVSTWELEQYAGKFISKNKVKAAFKGYRGFPCCLCTSINEEVVHGIPSKSRVLKEGDILSVDFGVVYKGYYGDAARTYPVGKISTEAQRLLDITEQALYLAIDKSRAGGHLSDISRVVQDHVEAAGFSVVRAFVGHGVGKKMHELPQVPNFVLSSGRGMKLNEGLVLAIEPMINKGSYEVEVLEDNWTAVTADRSLSAHFEHSVAITSDGPDILSALD